MDSLTNNSPKDGGKEDIFRSFKGVAEKLFLLFCNLLTASFYLSFLFMSIFPVL